MFIDITMARGKAPINDDGIIIIAYGVNHAIYKPENINIYAALQIVVYSLFRSTT